MKNLFPVLGVVCLLGAFRAGAQTPAILSEPQSVTVNNASAAAFAVSATNAATFQWYFNGTTLLGAATNATLNLDDVSTNNAGSYTVVVMSSNNISATSAPPAVLTIVPGTIIQWTISTYPNGGSSNFLVQLFDHDKPATVENFIHYITSGLYSNMFFDRDVTNFVLQGGDYTSEDRSDTNRGVYPISPGTNFPSQVDNEFGVGPLIHNEFGTLAMALQSGNTNSATSAFFFNLVDNSSNLDSQDFTVFGRILTGTNVLDYFNTLSAPSNGICTIFSAVPTLPVNYDSTNMPTDANFFYCDFSFISPTNAPVDTNLPVVSIAYPAPNEVFTNAGDLTATGTAQGFGLAQVFCILTPLTGDESGENETNAALGTANWSLDLGTNGPGIYQLTAYAQDGGGNLSAPVTEYFTNLVTLTIITNAPGELSTNIQYLMAGTTNSAVATPGAGELFVDWQVQGVTSLDPVQTFVAETSLTLEVTYAFTNLPTGLAITYPSAGGTAQTTNNALTLRGTLPSSVTVTQVTVQLFVQSNAVTTALRATISGTNWSVVASNLAGGPYLAVVVAADSLGQEGVVTETFTALTAPPVILSQSPIVTANAGSSAAFSVTASNAVSYQWQLVGTGPIAGATTATLTLNDLSTNQSGLTYEVVLTSSDGETRTSAPVVLTVETGTIIQFTVSKFADGSSNSFLVELFDHDKPATVVNFIHYVASGAYSNTFFDTDSNYVLQGGDFSTKDRLTNDLNIRSLPTGTNVFPNQISSEFNVGAVVPNTFGTLAARGSGRPDAGTGSFFFNLTDNSTNLDAAGYTVFGRILSGSNTLQYFASLSAPSNGLYADTNAHLYVLPVNDDSASAPSDANLFYCDFEFISTTNPTVETSRPSVSITYPASDAALTNGIHLTVRGTAQDTVPLAGVFCVVTSVAGEYAGQTQTNFAEGMTNWSLGLGAIAPGVYQLTAYAQDAEGDLGAPVTEYFTNQAILTIVTNVDGHLTTNAPEYLTPGQPYSVAAAVEAGEMFVDWQGQGVVSLDPLQTFTAESNLTLEVAYASTNPPSGLAITYPAAGSVTEAANGSLNISGTLPSSVTVTQLTVLLFSQSTAVTAALPATINGLDWSLAETNLAGGPYTIVAVAAGPSGQAGLVTENFSALTAPPVIVSQPQSSTNNIGSSADFSVTASNAVSYQWQLTGTGPISGATTATLALNDLGSNQSGTSYQVVVTSADGETVTSAPPAVLTVVPGTIIQWTISTFPDGGSSNFLVQLFDHDKPATVENFIHYVASGAFSNTFFDTDLTNEYLKGGDFVTTDRTTNLFNYLQPTTGTNFPSQIDSEFGVGPLIPNTFGTLGSVSSANIGDSTGGFFFNLADNSTNFDFDGYTVFGRILSGTNILQYFNTLSAPTNGIYTTTNIPALPVNYDGTNAPENANVFYCDFKFISPSNAPVDTNVPTVSISLPAPDASFTNGADVSATGTASGVGLAQVYCILTSLQGSTDGESETNAAAGTTNWSLDFGIINPGIYQLTAYAQDGSGSLSAPATEYFTNLAQLIIITNIDGQSTTNGPRYVLPGTQETVTASPGTGQQFYNWTVNGVVSLNPTQKFTMNEDYTLVVTYLTTNASNTVTIAAPLSGKEALSIQSVLTASGSIASAGATQLTCQFFLNSNAVKAPLPAVIAGTNWSLEASNLANGAYTMLAVASGAAGPISSASVSFNLTNVERLTLITNGGGTIVNTNSYPYLVPGSYTVKAVPAKGYAFYSWSDGVTASSSATERFQMESNLTLTATFVPNDPSLTGISITYPPANAMLTNGTFNIAGKLPRSQVFTRMTCQLFLQSNSVTASAQLVTINSNGTAWTFPVTNLTAGPYNIQALAYDAKGNIRLVTGSFNLLSKLTVTTQGPGTVTGGLNGKYLQVGKSYTITGRPSSTNIFAYWSGTVEEPTSATTAFIMSMNMVLTAYFTNNPFPAVAGAYTGLFFDPSAVSPTNAGFVRLTVTRTGAFSGDLMFPSIIYPISYAFPYTGAVVLPTAPNVFAPSNRLQLYFNLDLSNYTGVINGSLADLTSNGSLVWISSLTLNRNVTKLPASNAPAAGKYALLLPPQDASPGSVATGAAAESLTASGTLMLAGALPDNTAISESANLSQAGLWPVYIVPSKYNKKGMVIGWQTNTPSGSCDGQLFWYKPGAGAATNLTSTGAAFAAPAANSQYQMVLAGGATYELPVNKSGQFVSQAPLVGVSLQSGGLLTGSIQTNKTTYPFKGAFISPSEGGAGFVVEPGGQTEGFQIIPAP